jgi:hypothetical protein
VLAGRPGSRAPVVREESCVVVSKPNPCAPLDGRPNENTYWVVPGRLLAGEYPGAKDPDAGRAKLQRYLEGGFTCFVDLTEEGEMEPYAGWLPASHRQGMLDVVHERHAIRDLDVPSPAPAMAEILDAIDSALGRGHRVYTHCWGGVGRTGTVVGCYLVRHGHTGESALAQLQDWWRTVGARKRARYPFTPQTDRQIEFIRTWAQLDPRR